LGQTEKFGSRPSKSVLPSKADVARLKPQVWFVPFTALSNRSTAASSRRRWPLAALNQGQEQGARIAGARVLTRRVGLHPVRLLPGHLLQNPLKHYGRVTLIRRYFVSPAHSLKCALDAAVHAVEFALTQNGALRIDCISHHMSPLVGAIIRRRCDHICHHRSRRYVTAMTKCLI
jgi:hypothetical protein